MTFPNLAPGTAPGPALPPSPPVQIAVVGHTNVGKTSLLRTLLRDASFGAVSHRPSTTRHVEGAALRIGGETLLVLHDTP
ncbi:MAG: 50S ribosome-binding GTPase, partial [Comamonas sp.]